MTSIFQPDTPAGAFDAFIKGEIKGRTVVKIGA